MVSIVVDLVSFWVRDDLGSKEVIDYKKNKENFDLYLNVLDKLVLILRWLLRFSGLGWFY